MRLPLAFAVGATLFFAVPAHAITIQLSQMTSEQEEIDDDLCAVSPCGTPAGVLDATVAVEISGTDLKITIDNDSAYDISAVWINISGETVSAVSPAAAGDSGYELTAPPAEMVDGFGDFNVGVAVAGDVNLNDDRIDSGEQDVMILLSCLDGDCSDAVLVDNAKGKAVAAKFINGGAVYDESAANDPGGSNNDSAFGASSAGAVVPEPALGALALAGLAGLVGRRRRA
jgi:hypothetical protein